MLYMAAPLGNTRLHTGHDFSYHLLRIENIKDGLLNGQFPVRIGPLFLNHRGYASSLFYPELFLYIPALFRLAGFTIETSYKLFALLTIVGCFITTYLCAKGISKEKYTALITAVIFSACQYHIANLYVRGAVGEAQAFVFFPLVVYGIYDLIYRDFEKAWVMGLGFWGLMFSHSISLVIALCTSPTALSVTVVHGWLNQKVLDKSCSIMGSQKPMLKSSVAAAVSSSFLNFFQLNTTVSI